MENPNKKLSEILMIEQYSEEVNCSTGEITIVVNESIELSKKIDSVGFVYERFKKDIEAYEEREKIWKDKKQVAKNRLENFREWIRLNMAAFGFDRLKGAEFAFSLRDGQAELDVNEAELPETYFRTKVIREVDRERIREDIKAGIEISGVTQTPKKTLYIK